MKADCVRTADLQALWHEHPVPPLHKRPAEVDSRLHGCDQGVEVAEDVNYAALAERARGYSGDDLTGVCRDAALNGMRRRIAGLAPDQIKSVPASQLQSLKAQALTSLLAASFDCDRQCLDAQPMYAPPFADLILHCSPA